MVKWPTHIRDKDNDCQDKVHPMSRLYQIQKLINTYTGIIFINISIRLGYNCGAVVGSIMHRDYI